MGIDKHDDVIKGSIMIQNIKPDQSIENFTFSATGLIILDVIAQMQHEASQPIKGEALDVALVEDEFAREGINQVLDPFLRDPSIGVRLIFGIVDGKAEKMLQGNYGIQGNNQYLRGLVEHNTKDGDLPRTNL